jgi:hypothetical protein
MKSTRRTGVLDSSKTSLARLACIFLVAGRFIYHQRAADEKTVWSFVVSESRGLYRACDFLSFHSMKHECSGPCAMATARKAASDGDADHLAVCFPARRRPLARGVAGRTPTRAPGQVGATRYTLLYGRHGSFNKLSTHPCPDARVPASWRGRCQQLVTASSWPGRPPLEFWDRARFMAGYQTGPVGSTARVNVISLLSSTHATLMRRTPDVLL